LDKATGTGHFEVSETEALALIRQIQATLPGYMVPKLGREPIQNRPFYRTLIPENVIYFYHETHEGLEDISILASV